MWTTVIRKLFTFKGYVVDKVSVNDAAAQIDLRRDHRVKASCPTCGRPLQRGRQLWQMARDLPWGPLRCVFIRYEVFQGYCAACRSYVTLHPEGIVPHAKATARLKALVSRLCRFMPLSHIHDVVPVSAATAYRWDKAHLEKTLAPPCLDGLRVLLIDEKAVRKHYGFVTLVMNGETGELLHWAEGKKKESLEPFFEQLSDEQKRGIQAVAIDRNGAYYQVVRQQIPQAAVVYDKFHLLQNYHKVLDRIRNAEYRKASAEDQKVIKGQRFNLYRNPENLSPEQARDLQALLALNENLSTAYVLKDALKRLWTYRYPACALKYLAQWVGWARESAIPVLVQFAEGLWRDRQEIVAYCRHPITTGRLEGFNNTVSRFIHRACGVRDLNYFFLKMRQESLTDALQT